MIRQDARLSVVILAARCRSHRRPCRNSRLPLVPLRISHGVPGQHWRESRGCCSIDASLGWRSHALSRSLARALPRLHRRFLHCRGRYDRLRRKVRDRPVSVVQSQDDRPMRRRLQDLQARDDNHLHHVMHVEGGALNARGNSHRGMDAAAGQSVIGAKHDVPEARRHAEAADRGDDA